MQTKSRQAIRFYWQFYESKRLALLLTSCLLILQPIALSATLYGIKLSFDNMLASNTFRSLLFVSLGLIFVYLFSGGLALFVRYRMMQLTHGAIQDLRRALSTRLYAFSRAQYTKFDRKQLQTTLVQDVIRVDVMTNALVGQLIPSLVVLSSMIVILVYLNFQLFLIVACIFPLLLSLEYLVRPVLRRHIQRHHRSLEDLQKHVLFGLEALDMTHSRGSEWLEINAQVQAGERFRHVSTTLAMMRETLHFAQDVLMLVVSVVCLLVGGLFVVQEQMTGGDLLVFYAVIVLLRPYLRNSWSNIPLILEGVESLKTLTDWLSLPRHIAQFGLEQFTFSGDVRFEYVTFSYNEQALLTDINLHIRAGQTVTILGANGVGKSTLAYLLLGFYQPQAGNIYVDGKLLTEVGITPFRQQIGVVPQQPYIFQGSILDNISYGFPSIGMDDVIEAAYKAQLHSFVEALPDNYHTLIGDNGMMLSGGQRQRIVLARALLSNPTFLILDEPTNHLDSQSIEGIMRNLRSADYQPTIFLITHDDSFSDLSNMTYELKNNRLYAASPTHQSKPVPQ